MKTHREIQRVPPSSPESPQILFEDQHLKVFAHRGRTDHVLITFGDMLTPGPVNAFYAEAVARKREISAVGFMAKSPHWYRVASMNEAVRCVLPWIGLFRTRVIYGGSMGGYAGIKFSRALGATHVLAMVPQWSIDPAECAPFNPGYRQNFRPFMADMGIRAEDVAGELWMVWDDLYPQDHFHASRILQICPAARCKPMRHIGHHVTVEMSGSSSLQCLIQAALADDMQMFAAAVEQRRRSSQLRIGTVLGRAVLRHPTSLLRWYERTHACLPPQFDGFGQLVLPALVSLRRKGQGPLAVQWAERLSASHWSTWSDPQRKLLRVALEHASATTWPRQPGTFIRTSHGTFLVLDLIKQNLAHVSETALTDPRYVPCRLHHQDARVGLALAAYTDHGLQVNMTGVTHVELVDAISTHLPTHLPTHSPQQAGSSMTTWKQVPVPDMPGHFALKSALGHASAQPNGSLEFQRAQVQRWEQFTLT